MVNAKKHRAKKQNRKEETKEEFIERIISQMQAGFKWSKEEWTIREIVKAWGEGILIDPKYQRKKVWKNPKNKALIETILHHGGNKIPTLTFRKLSNGKFEIVDGKQRILSAILPFVNDEFRLNGVYEDRFSGRNFSDIREELSGIDTAFMGQTLNVQVATNMSEEAARVYFIQINTSGVNMNVGEQIHGMQGTPLIKTIEELLKHPVWNNVKNLKRYSEYAYVSRMLLHVIDNEENGESIIVYNNKQLINNLEKYYELNLPKSAISTAKKTLTILSKIFVEKGMCLNAREFFTLFIYVNMHLDKINVSKFGEFIGGLYKNIHSGKGGVFKGIKYKPEQNGFDYNARYYQWYINNVNYLYAKYLNGANWNEIQQLSTKE